LLIANKKEETVPGLSDKEAGRLGVWAAINDTDEVVIRIEPDKQNPERFTYTALTNKFFSNPEKYLKVEVKENATAQEVVRAVYRIIANRKELRIPKPLID
ncbi:MAG: hypothetical protein AAFQ01_01305, partial [Bacteroidota bacterium]